jgi:Holliday junction resolvasome RuvABC endonuclease subunit
MGYITLDISTNCTGWTIANDKHEPIAVGKIQIDWKYKNTICLDDKVYIQCKQLNQILKQYKKDIKFAIPETPFTGRNKKIGLNLSEVRGALKFILRHHKIRCIDGYSPKTIKKAVCNKGNAEKEELAKIIIEEFKNNKVVESIGEFNDKQTKNEWLKKNDDIYDSLGIVICHKKSGVDFN